MMTGLCYRILESADNADERTDSAGLFFNRDSTPQIAGAEALRFMDNSGRQRNDLGILPDNFGRIQNDRGHLTGNLGNPAINLGSIQNDRGRMRGNQRNKPNDLGKTRNYRGRLPGYPRRFEEL
jgi:hypothetical protein